MFREVLGNRQFLKLWGAQLASQIAAQLLNYALVIRIFNIAQGTRYANSAVSLLIVAIAIPAVLFAVPAGAFVDQRDRKRVLVWSNALRAMLVPLFIFFDTQVIAIYVIALLISVFSQFFVPAEGAALPRLVHKDQLTVANSLFIFTLNASFIIGYSLAAPIIGKAGIQAVYISVTLAFVIALLFSLSLPAMAPLEKVKFRVTNMLAAVRRDLQHHFRHIIRTRTLLFPILLISIAQTMVGVIAALSPALSQALFKADLSQTGHWLIIPAGVGLIVGSVLAGKLLTRISKVRLAYIAIFTASGLLIWLAILPHIFSGDQAQPYVAVTTFILGLFDAIILVSAQTLLQLASTDRLRGQIFGTLNMMINVAALLPVFLAGILADIFSPLTVLAGMGTTLAMIGLLFILIFRKISQQYA